MLLAVLSLIICLRQRSSSLAWLGSARLDSANMQFVERANVVAVLS